MMQIMKWKVAYRQLSVGAIQKVDGCHTMAEEHELPSYPLHECVFEGDVQEFSRLMRTEDLSRKDKHGKYWSDIVIVIYH